MTNHTASITTSDEHAAHVAQHDAAIARLAQMLDLLAFSLEDADREALFLAIDALEAERDR